MSRKRIAKEPAAKQPAEPPKPRRRPPLPGALDKAGNAAVSHLLGGQPLGAATRSAMEQSYGADFEGVRLHRDADAQSAASTLDATAFTQGDDIYLGADAPSPESTAGQSLIAHELAHVVQQRGAGTVEAEAVSEPGDPSEQAAQAGAARALQGQSANAQAGGVVAGTQRQRKSDLSITKSYTFTRAEVQAMLTEYFQTQVAAQGGGRGVRITPAVETAVRKLFAGADVGTLIGVDGILKETILRPPNELAKRIGQLLPDDVPGQNVAHLGRKPPSPDKPSFTDRVKDAAEKTAPAELPPDMQADQFRRDQETKELRKNDPGLVGPYSVDVLRLARIAGELTKKSAKPAKNVEVKTYPAVETAIKGIATDALVPPGVAKENADSYADAQAVARELARLLDSAHDQKSADITIALGQNYNAVKDPSPVYKKLKEIALLIKAALPHHAPGVSRMNVAFGGRVVQYISLDTSSK